MANDDDLWSKLGLEGLDLTDPVRRAQFIGHLKLMKAAAEFLQMAVRDGDLRGAWGMVHESLRNEWAQQWAIDNQRDIHAGGFDEAEVIAGLASSPPSHQLWPHFERVYVRSLRRELPDPDHWAMGTETRIIGPDLEELDIHDKRTVPQDGVLRPGQVAIVCPLVFQRADDQWRLAMFGRNALVEDS